MKNEKKNNVGLDSCSVCNTEMHQRRLYVHCSQKHTKVGKLFHKFYPNPLRKLTIKRREGRVGINNIRHKPKGSERDLRLTLVKDKGKMNDKATSERARVFLEINMMMGRREADKSS